MNAWRRRMFRLRPKGARHRVFKSAEKVRGRGDGPSVSHLEDEPGPSPSRRGNALSTRLTSSFCTCTSNRLRPSETSDDLIIDRLWPVDRTRWYRWESS